MMADSNPQANYGPSLDIEELKALGMFGLQKQSIVDAFGAYEFGPQRLTVVDGSTKGNVAVREFEPTDNLQS